MLQIVNCQTLKIKQTASISPQAVTLIPTFLLHFSNFLNSIMTNEKKVKSVSTSDDIA